MTIWPGGCPHRFHDACRVALYQHADNGRPACPTCRAGVVGCPQPTQCEHGNADVCAQGCGERCTHNRWTGTGGCRECGQPAGMDGRPGHSAAKRSKMGTLQREFGRLSENGVPAGYRWSQILCPFYLDVARHAHGAPSATRIPKVGAGHATDQVRGGNAQKTCQHTHATTRVAESDEL